MKTKTIIIAAIAFVSLTMTGFAQARYAPVDLAVPTITAGATSNSIAQLIDCRYQNNVAIQWKVNTAVMGAGTNLVANFGASVDGSTFSTNAFSITINATTAPNGVFVTNIALNGFGWLRLDSATSTGVAATNTVKYAIKRGAN